MESMCQFFLKIDSRYQPPDLSEDTDHEIGRIHVAGLGQDPPGQDSPDGEHSVEILQHVHYQHPGPHTRNIEKVKLKKWIQLQIFLNIFFAFLCLGDTTSDIFTAILYFFERDMGLFLVTVGIVIVAGLTLTIMNLYFYHAEYKEEERLRAYQTPPCMWFLRVVCSLFLIGPFLRHLEMAWCLSQSIGADKKKSEAIRSRVSTNLWCVTILSLVEAFIESAPQLGVQLYVLFIQGDKSAIRTISQAVCCTFSLMSCATSLVSQARVHRLDNIPLGKPALILIFLWRLTMVGSRILALALIASVTRYYVIFSIIIAHWLLCLIYISWRRFSYPDAGNLSNFFQSVVIGFVFVFTDINTSNGYRRLPYISYYVLLYAENIAMVVTWFILTPHTQQTWFHLPTVISVSVAFVLGIVFMVIYYIVRQIRLDSNSFTESQRMTLHKI